MLHDSLTMKYSADLEDHDTKGKAEDRKQTEGPCDTVLHGDMLARIMSYLAWKEVMNCRVVNHVWREAARNAPIQELYVDREDVALALQAIWVVSLKQTSHRPSSAIC